jgi:hypothetical protein
MVSEINSEVVQDFPGDLQTNLVFSRLLFLTQACQLLANSRRCVRRGLTLRWIVLVEGIFMHFFYFKSV